MSPLNIVSMTLSVSKSQLVSMPVSTGLFISESAKQHACVYEACHVQESISFVLMLFVSLLMCHFQFSESVKASMWDSFPTEDSSGYVLYGENINFLCLWVSYPRQLLKNKGYLHTVIKTTQ